jgi:DNA repair ATPase RecN
MKKSEKREQLLRAIQEYVTQEGLTPADFVRLVHKRGGDVSDSTLRRMLNSDAETRNFSFEALQQATKALFGVDSAPIPVEDINSAEAAEMEALRAVTSLTDSAFQEAQERIAQLETKLAEAEKKLEQLIELCDFRKQQMTEKDRQIDRLWKLIEK